MKFEINWPVFAEKKMFENVEGRTTESLVYK